MSGVKHMVAGFNHNVKHRGKAYHVQTEDSGVQNPHITTHLFLGGNILASKKTSYADVLAAENLAEVVRELMEEQHKEMLRNLVNGVYDDRDEALSAKARSYQPGQLATDGATKASAAPTVITARPSGKPPRAPPPRAAASAPPAAPRAAPVVLSKPAPPPAAAAAPTPAPRVVFRPALTPPPVLSRPAPAAVAARPAAAAPGAPAAHPTAPAPKSAAPAHQRAAADGPATDKSLDQAILSYLAGEEPRTRK